MNIENHPCFSENAKHKYGRIHLPVAPKCNIQCRFCDRKFDCVNESRPGVASSILTPVQAVRYLDSVMQKIHNLSVVGIAGPGDPFANAYETIETMRLVREKYTEILLCVATNGLEVEAYADELKSLDVSHVTVTVNGIDPEITEKIYSWVRHDKKVFRGIEGAEVLLQQQLKGIRKLKEKGITVKINTVVIPGINDHHVADIAGYVKALGADIFNCMPVVHVQGTEFENIIPPSREMIEDIRERASVYMPQMTHCSRCRADAVGMLGEKHNDEMIDMLKNASMPQVSAERPYVAAASMEGIFVNSHLGEAHSLWIFELKEGRSELVETRLAPAAGGGIERWEEMAELLSDCNTILVSGIGKNPQMILERSDIRVVAMEGLIAEGVESLLTGNEIPKIMLCTPGKCGAGKGCSGTGGGCG